MRLPELIEEYRQQFILALLGLFLLGVGVLSVVVVSIKQSEPEVEILSTDESGEEETGDIFVDVEGSVEKPGVYQLSSGARVNDVLVSAGGLSSDADRDWVSKYINLAIKVSDGMKIYIPSKSEKQSVSAPAEKTTSVATVDQGEVIGLATEGKISINSASASELDSLWGIGEKRAVAIIENRPFGSIEELLEKKIVPSNVYERIKDQISI